MAKRKKLKNVVISNEELTPTTIGYLNEKDGGIFFLFIVFGIFFAFLYFVPEINQYIETKRGNDYSQNNPTVPENPVVEENETNAGKEFDFNQETTIVMGELVFSGFKTDIDTISLKVKNNSKNIINCEEKEYYLILKNEEGKISNIINLGEIVVLSEAQTDYSFSVSSVDISKIIIDELSEKYLENLVLNDNKLTCSMSGASYIYDFNEDNLKSITYTYTSLLGDSSSSYYKGEAERLKEFEGIEVKAIEETNFVFDLKIDLAKVDKKNLEDYYIYEIDQKPEVVNYKMKELGYSCS